MSIWALLSKVFLFVSSLLLTGISFLWSWMGWLHQGKKHLILFTFVELYFDFLFVIERGTIAFQVDDMRTIIHNLGKFYSKRAVKVRIHFFISGYWVFSHPYLWLTVPTLSFFVFSWKQELLRVAVQESNKDHDGRIYYMKLLKVNLWGMWGMQQLNFDKVLV